VPVVVTGIDKVVLMVLPTPALIAPKVPLVAELPTMKGVVVPPPWRIVIAPSPAVDCPTLQILVPPGQGAIALPVTRSRFPALILIAPLLFPPKNPTELIHADVMFPWAVMLIEPPLPLLLAASIDPETVIFPWGALRVIAPALLLLLAACTD
jgi:hypothetical protein